MEPHLGEHFDGRIFEVTCYSGETLRKARAAIQGDGFTVRQSDDVVHALQNAGILFRERT